MNDDILVDALADLAGDLDGDHVVEPTVVVLGDVPTYEDKVPDGFSERISGTQVGEFAGHPIVQFSPRAALVDDKKGGLVLKDGHLGGRSDYPDSLPVEFEHFISRIYYVAAVIYQEQDDVPPDERDPVQATDIGNITIEEIA